MDIIQPGQRVSFFELYACERFKGVFDKGMNYTLNILFEETPLLTPFRYYKEELILGLNLLLQGFYIRKFGGTFFEYFYNITRENKMKVEK